MFRAQWLTTLMNVARPRKYRRRQSAPSRKPIRLVLESLEERLTPSAPVQTAGSYTDLMNAIAADTAANTNYVIQITNNFTFNSGGQVSISKLGAGSTLSIEGQNGTNFTLTGNGNRLFSVASAQNVTFADLTLTGGSVTNSNGNAQGGAILDQGGNVTLSKVIVQNNTVIGVTTHAEGGGAFVSAGGSLTIQGGSVFQSNHAVGTGDVRSMAFGGWQPGSAAGGGLYVNGGSNVTISDSTFSKNSAQGAHGEDGNSKSGGLAGSGGSAYGGGLYVTGSGWTVTLMGDTLSENSVVGGDGGNGAAGVNATPLFTAGSNGGNGFQGGTADGGAAYFSVSSSNGNGSLTILNDAANPSIFIDNSAEGGNGGSGGAGGSSTGTATNSNGGNGGSGGGANGGALYIVSETMNGPQAMIGNTAFYGNSVTGGNGGTGGAAGTGGLGPTGVAGSSAIGSLAEGGGLALGGGIVTIVNCTVAKNTGASGADAIGGQDSYVIGSGIYDAAGQNVILANNTITQNSNGDGVDIDFGNPIIVNNLIQDIGSFSNRFLTALNYNFITSTGYSSTTSIVGSDQPQLGNVVGVDANGNPTGGPIYYPLLSNVVSIGYGTTAILDTIANVEGTTSATATDQLGNPRTTNGLIDLGAIQSENSISPSAPAITVNPASQSVSSGGTVLFTASASGAPTPTMQWQVSTDGGKTFSDIGPLSTIAPLKFVGVTAAMNGNEYRAVISNYSGSVTTAVATLTVTAAPAAPSITTQPSSQTVTAGQSATFTASASGSPTPTVQWDVSSDGGKTFSSVTGATSLTLTLNNVTTAMSDYEYEAVFTNSVGSVTSSAATLTVKPVPPSPSPPPPSSPLQPLLNVPPLLTFFNSFLGGIETVNANGAVTITDSIFGIPLIVSTFDSHGDLVSVDLFEFFNITFLFG